MCVCGVLYVMVPEEFEVLMSLHQHVWSVYLKVISHLREEQFLFGTVIVIGQTVVF